MPPPHALDTGRDPKDHHYHVSCLAGCIYQHLRKAAVAAQFNVMAGTESSPTNRRRSRIRRSSTVSRVIFLMDFLSSTLHSGRGGLAGHCPIHFFTFIVFRHIFSPCGAYDEFRRIRQIINKYINISSWAAVHTR